MHGLLTLTRYSDFFMHAVGGHFDCWAMKDYLFKNTFPLYDLPCDQITNDLVAYNIISYTDKMYRGNHVSRALNNIQSSLYQQQPKIFKNFLLVMERSGNAVLEEAAKQLG